MNIVQIIDSNNQTVAAIVKDDELELLSLPLYPVAIKAANSSKKLADVVSEYLTGEVISYESAIREQRLRAPLTHPDPAHCLISGTGLTHLGSADTRSAMHAKAQADESELTDTMRMFKLGVEGGKPLDDKPGAQPEWFYKGDGSIVIDPEAELPVPAFAEDAGEEPELAGLYIIADDGRPWRVGYAIGNEFSDHVTERHNYLWLAHSKLRACSFGPELLIGDLPEHLEGISRIVRDDRTLWEKPFLTGESNMAHSLANLEYHHFKYPSFRRPGDVHVHYFGTATLSFADGIKTRDGDRFEVELPAFGRPLRNPLRFAQEDAPIKIRSL